jgi:predicted TIM-barrel fold metal-dependent hydrolase
MEVVFPDADVLGIGGVVGSPFGTGLGASGADDAALALAGARAHNRWLAELCAANPDRRIGVATIPVIHDVEAGIAEAIRAVEDGITGGVLIPSQWAPKASYNDPIYDPFWSTCQDLGLVIAIHSGGTPRDVSMAPGMLPILSSEAWFFAARPMWQMIWGGVFERFPDLKLALTEDGAWWLPGMLGRMDDAWIGTHSTLKFESAYREALPEKPSFYFNRNCYLGAGMTEQEMAMRYEIGVGNVVWGNDFPHPEGTWPHTRDWLRIKFHGVPENETRQMLGLNAIECYGLDLAPLEAIAEQIGPSPAEIHDQPPPPNPDQTERAASRAG